MSIEKIREAILQIVLKYPIKKVVLFGSRATEHFRADSDIDLIIEFYDKITLLTLSEMKLELETLLGIDVDIIHGPVSDSDLIEVKRTVELYAA